MINAFQATLIGGLALLPPALSIDQSLWQNEALILIETLLESPHHFDQTNSLIKRNILPNLRDKPAQCCLILLPLIAYYHDDLRTLQKNLDQIIRTYQLSQTTQECLYLWTETITAALRRKLSPSSLIPQLIANHPHFILNHSLMIVQEGLESGISLRQLPKNLSLANNKELIPFFLSLFAFCATPDSLMLSLNRLRYLNLSPVMLGLISALGGAYGNFQGMPWTWRISLQQNQAEALKIRKIKQLWHKWSGNLDYNREVPPLSSIISPLIMQERPFLRLVSHQEYLNFPCLRDTESEPSLIIEDNN